jgi:hypothetical protein
MVRTPILVFIGFFFLASAHAFAAAPDAGTARSVAEASKRVESARAALATAVQRIEKEPPSNADLDAALAAVEALKDALNAGASFETEDLDYARTVLAARKQLRTQREYVEERRAKVGASTVRSRPSMSAWRSSRRRTPLPSRWTRPGPRWTRSRS